MDTTFSYKNHQSIWTTALTFAILLPLTLHLLLGEHPGRDGYSPHRPSHDDVVQSNLCHTANTPTRMSTRRTSGMRGDGKTIAERKCYFERIPRSTFTGKLMYILAVDLAPGDKMKIILFRRQVETVLPFWSGSHLCK